MKKRLLIILASMTIIVTSASLTNCDDPTTPGPRSTAIERNRVINC